jgi:hypothetical protein
MFRGIASDGFPPFGKFQMAFPPVENKPADVAEVHLLTGVNGTGKTRLLALLAAMLGGPAELSTRVKGLDGRKVVCLTDKGSASDTVCIDDAVRALSLPDRSIEAAWARILVGEQGIGWVDGNRTAAWALQVPAFAHNGADRISDADIAVMAVVSPPPRPLCLSFSRVGAYSGQLVQAIANLKVQAAMDSTNAGPGKAATRSVLVAQTLERTLSEITDQPFQFHVTAYPKPALYVRWANSEMPFNLLPDGLRSILAWLVEAVVMMDLSINRQDDINDTEAVFLLDEIESHLHPVWQRRVLPAFQRLFPKAQIFVATHSPFVIASLTHGWIHRLTMQPNGEVTVLPPHAASAGDSYISVLEDIMGLEEWYNPETEDLLKEFRAQRDRAYHGDADAKAKALELAEKLGHRSLELQYVMGRELSQMERQLAKPKVK